MAPEPVDRGAGSGGDETTAVAAPAQRSRLRRALRAVAWSAAGLVALIVLLAAAGWWWLGSDRSLAFTLSRAARYLPAGQTLESRDVSGSLRAGGRIGWLRWQGPTLAVELRDARIGWRLAPLLQRKVQIGEVHAAQLSIERRGTPSETPTEPLQSIELPVEVELPFRIDDLRWAGPPALQATALAGSYRYTGGHHRLAIDGVDIAQGHYSGRVDLQGAAPMALDLALDGRVQAPLPEGRSLEVIADAQVKGTLSGEAARLRVEAELKPVAAVPPGTTPGTTPSAAAAPAPEEPMQASLAAQIAPWRPQPVIDAQVDLRSVDAAALWPGAPRTLLTGRLTVAPAADAPAAATGGTGWRADADIRNADTGPWDQGKLPLERIEARVGYDGTTWQVVEATLRAGGGRIDATGDWRPAPAPWQAHATIRGVRPGALHTALEGAPLDGSVEVGQRGESIAFDVALQSAGKTGSAVLKGLRIDRARLQGDWQTAQQVLDLRTLRVEAERARVDGRLQLRVADQAGSGNLTLQMPGGGADLQGRIAPNQGAGDVQLRIDDAATLQRWVEALPGLDKVFAGARAQGTARLDARWTGGWQALQRRLQAAGTPAPRGLVEPTLQATLSAPRLDLRLPPAIAATPAAPAGSAGVAGTATDVRLRDLRAELSGSLAQATLTLRGEAGTGTRTVSLDARASGGLARTGEWRAALAGLRVRLQDSVRPGPWTLELGRPIDATLRTVGDRLDVQASAAEASLSGPVPGTVRIDWQPLRFSQGGSGAQRSYRLQSKGRLRGLPLGWAEALGAGTGLSDAGVVGDLVFDGDWDIDAGEALRASVRLFRQSGDIRVQAGESALVTRIVSRGTGTAAERTLTTAGGGTTVAGGGNALATGTPAGLRQAELRLDAQGDAVKATLTWDSERAGVVNADVGTRLVQRDGGWQWPADAPLAGRLRARLPNLGVWSVLAPPGWRIAGTLDADATLSGSRTAPRWNGTLGADGLALRAPVEGLDLQGGRLRATLAGDRLDIAEFRLNGGAGSSVRIAGQSGNRSTSASEAGADGGSVVVTGNVQWNGIPTATASGIRMALDARLQRLRVLVRSDRQVTLSGGLQARLDAGQFTVRGDLRTDRAVVILPDEGAPSLGSDVVVRSAAKDREAAEAAKALAARGEATVDVPTTLPVATKAPDIAVSFDLGDDFAVQGRGITTRLEGRLDIRSAAPGAPPRIVGEVRTVRGRYRAYGQELDVETGIARFNGPYDNPQLDILAIRPNIAQRAGVQISGSAQSPRVKLYSDPPLSDAETLSWVVLGRAQASSGGESALLQQAALALLGGFGKGGTGGGLASRFGLDEIGFKGPSGGDVRGSAVTLGKRLSKDFYVTYERSLSGTLGTIFIFYDLTQRLTLRGQAGQKSGLDLIYTLKYD